MDTMYFTVKPKSPADAVVTKLLAQTRAQTIKAYAVLKAEGVPMTKGFSVCSLNESVCGFGHDNSDTLKAFITKHANKWKLKEGYALPNHKTAEGRALKKALTMIPRDITASEIDLAITGSDALAMGRIAGMGFYIPHCSLRALHSGKVKPLIGIPTTMYTKRKSTLVKGLVELTQSAVLKLKTQHKTS